MADEKPQRDENGRFIKGHQFTKSTGIKTGRKKSIAGEFRDALKIAEDAAPDLIIAMIDRAQNSDHRDAQRATEYLLDRLYGKARQGVDLDHEIGITLRVIYPEERIEHIGVVSVIEGREREKPLYLVE